MAADITNPITAAQTPTAAGGTGPAVISGPMDLSPEMFQGAAPLIKAGEPEPEIQDETPEIEDESLETGDEVTEIQDESSESQDDSSDEPYHIDLGEFDGQNTYSITLPDGRTLELPAGAKVTNRVDGKIEEFVLGDQLGVASGEVVVQRKLTALKALERDLVAREVQSEERIARSEGVLNGFSEKLQSGNSPLEAFEYLIDNSDIPPGQMIKKIMEANNSYIQQIFNGYVYPEMVRRGEDPNTNKALVQELYLKKFYELDGEWKSKKVTAEASRTAQKAASQKSFNSWAEQRAGSLGLNEHEVQLGLANLEKAGYVRDPDHTQEQFAEKVFEEAVLVKKSKLLFDAISKVDSRLLKSNDIIKELGGMISVGQHKPEDVEKLVRLFAKNKFSPTGKKVLAKNLASKNTIKYSNGSSPQSGRNTVVKGANDIGKMYGLK